MTYAIKNKNYVEPDGIQKLINRFNRWIGQSIPSEFHNFTLADPTPKRISDYLTLHGKKNLSELLNQDKQTIDTRAREFNRIQLNLVGDVGSAKKLLQTCLNEQITDEIAGEIDLKDLAQISMDFFFLIDSDSVLAADIAGRISVTEAKKDHENEVAEDFIEYLRDLVLFCAGRDPIYWKAIWTTWRYSEVVEYSLHRFEVMRKEGEDLSDMDYEYSEQYIVALLMRIASKL